MKTGIAILDRDVGHPLGHFRVQHKRPIAIAESTLNILAPIDLSIDPATRVEAAIAFARGLGAHLTLLNVRGTNKPKFDWPPSVMDGSLAGVVDPWTLGGSVPETVTRFASFISADLILLSPRSFAKWTPFESVTSAVMALSDRPVLISTGEARKWRTILCALNLLGNDEPAVRLAEALARRTGAELLLFGTVPDSSEGLLHDVLSGTPLSLSVAGERMRRIGRSLRMSYKSLILRGSMADGIGQAAKEHSADIVIANRNELDPRKVFRKLNCPLLSVMGPRTPGRTVRDIVEEESHAATGG